MVNSASLGAESAVTLYVALAGSAFKAIVVHWARWSAETNAATLINAAGAASSAVVTTSSAVPTGSAGLTAVDARSGESHAPQVTAAKTKTFTAPLATAARTACRAGVRKKTAAGETRARLARMTTSAAAAVITGSARLDPATAGPVLRVTTKPARGSMESAL